VIELLVRDRAIRYSRRKKVVLEFVGGRMYDGRVVAGTSTRSGTYSPGQSIRLVIELEGLENDPDLTVRLRGAYLSVSFAGVGVRLTERDQEDPFRDLP
jgi:hypothetical protein